jgi:hypothetical protein
VSNSFLSGSSLAAATGSTVRASSAQPAWPVSRLRDQSPGKTWRSKTGWTIVDGWNNRIDYVQGGAGSVTIAAGTYEAAALCALIKAALDTATGNTWTVTYSANAFTFACGVAFSLKAAANPVAMVQDLGFVADTASGTSATGARTYQSRHYVVIDCGTSQEPTFAAITGGLTSSAIYKVSKSDTSEVAAALAALAGTSLVGTAVNQTATVSGSGRYWALVVNDTGNDAASFAELGIFWLGSKTVPVEGIAGGWRMGAESLSDLAYSAGGTHYRFARRARRIFDVIFRLQDAAARNAWLAFGEAVGTGGNFWFVAQFPDASEKVLYGYLDTIPQPEHEPESLDLWNVALPVREVL